MRKNVHPALKVIDHWLRYQMAHGDLPGMQVSIRDKGRLVFSKAYGFANREKSQRYSTKHIGQMASHSKMVTACL